MEVSRAGDGQEVTTDDMEIVSVLRATLADKVGKERFELWFGPTTGLDFVEDDLVITTPNQFFRDFLRSSFHAQIDAACSETLGRQPRLIFRIDQSLPNPSPKPPVIKSATPGLSDSAPAEITPRNPRSADSGCKNKKSPRGKFSSLDDFIVGDCNQMALSVARKVIRHPGHYSPLMFHGPTSVGKTHLLEGILTAARRTPQGPAAMYLTAEQFTTLYVDALRGSGLPSFRGKYRNVDILIIDDIQFFQGKRSTLVELLYTIDTLVRAGRQVVVAADRSPVELRDLGGELITRIEGGMICQIESPDYAVRRGIVAQMAGRMKLNIPDAVQEFIASRLTNHARELRGAMCRLQAASEAFARPVTLDMAEETLADMIRQSGRLVRLPDIQRAVCKNFGIEPESLASPCKSKAVNHARMLAMWLARKHTRAALSEISAFFGRRSHSTVISAQRRVDGWIAAKPASRLFEDSSTVDETIRRIEQSLLAG